MNVNAFDEYGYDGEDFIAFNYSTLQWVDQSPKAKETRMKWDAERFHNLYLRSYLNSCMDSISTFNASISSTCCSNDFSVLNSIIYVFLFSIRWVVPISFIHDVLLIAASPVLHMFTSGSPHDQSKLNLTCLATGFYPKHIEMKITLNNITLQPFSSTGVRPSDDQTFQMRTSVEIHRDEKQSYECRVLHSSQIFTSSWGKYYHINSQKLILLYSSLLLQLAAQK